MADFARVKEQNKKRLADYVFKKQGIALDVNSVFDVQAKRLHEYKRQLLKVLHILHLYNRFTGDEGYSLPRPVTFFLRPRRLPFTGEPRISSSSFMLLPPWWKPIRARRTKYGLFFWRTITFPWPNC